MSARTYEFPLTAKEIKEFQFQTRPFHWVTFRNVSLRPGKRTEVGVSTRPPTDASPATELDPAGEQPMIDLSTLIMPGADLAPEDVLARIVQTIAPPPPTTESEEAGTAYPLPAKFSWRIIRNKPCHVVQSWEGIDQSDSPHSEKEVGGSSTGDVTIELSVSAQGDTLVLESIQTEIVRGQPAQRRMQGRVKIPADTSFTYVGLDGVRPTGEMGWTLWHGYFEKEGRQVVKDVRCVLHIVAGPERGEGTDAAYPNPTRGTGPRHPKGHPSRRRP